MSRDSFVRSAVLVVLIASCATGGATLASSEPTTAAVASVGTVPNQPLASPIARSLQLVVVTTPAWDSTSGTMRRYERDAAGRSWREVGAAVPIVVGRTGLAWDEAIANSAGTGPVKREGDGRSPAGAFALDTAFGFDIRQIVPWVRLPYVQLRQPTECVDDPRSAHYNTIVDRSSVARVDWSSAERMREIEQYAFGVHVAYNAAPVRLIAAYVQTTATI